MTREEFESEYANIRKKMFELEGEIEHLKKEYVKSVTDIRVGDLIEVKGKRYLVRKVELWVGNSALIKASKIKKDGNPSRVENFILPSDKPIKVTQNEQEDL